MAAHLHFAGAPQVARVDVQSGKRVGARDDEVIRENRPELEWKGIERLAELVRADKQRRCQAGVVPAGHPVGARTQVIGGHVPDDGQGRRGLVGRVAPGPVHHDRLEPFAEDGPKIAFEASHRVRHHHRLIVGGFADHRRVSAMWPPHNLSPS